MISHVPCDLGSPDGGGEHEELPSGASKSAFVGVSVHPHQRVLKRGNLPSQRQKTPQAWRAHIRPGEITKYTKRKQFSLPTSRWLMGGFWRSGLAESMPQGERGQQYKVRQRPATLSTAIPNSTKDRNDNSSHGNTANRQATPTCLPSNHHRYHHYDHHSTAEYGQNRAIMDITQPTNSGSSPVFLQ